MGHLSSNYDHFQLNVREVCLISKAHAFGLLFRWYQLEQISWDCICCFSALISRTVPKMVCQQPNWVQNLWACTYFSSQENHFLSFLEVDYNMLFFPLLESKISIRIYHFVLWQVFLNRWRSASALRKMWRGQAKCIEDIIPPKNSVACGQTEVKNWAVIQGICLVWVMNLTVQMSSSQIICTWFFWKKKK